MSPGRSRFRMTACAAVLALLAMPSPGRAGGLDWIFPWNWGKPKVVVVAYAPPCAVSYASCYAPACGAAPSCTTCAMPVVAAAPVVAYRPVTTWTYQPQLVPYTSYRVAYPVSYSVYYPASTYYYAPACCPTACCPTSGCPTVSCPSACDSCGVGGGTYSMPGTSCPTGGCGVASTPPALPQTSGGSPPPDSGYAPPSSPSTYRPEEQQAPDMRLKPTPDSNTESGAGSGTMAPAGTSGPVSPGPVRPIRQASLFREVSRPVYDPSVQPLSYQSPSPPEPLDVSGWRAARN